jgi:hypothetical protein
MRFSIRYLAAVVLTFGMIACSRPAEQTPEASSPAQPSKETSSPATPPADQAVKAEAPAGVPVNRAVPEASRPTTKSPAATSATEPAKATAAAPPDPTKSLNATPPAPPKPEIVTIPAGTVLTVTMIDSVGTDTNKVGDTFVASVAEPVVVNGKTALAKGTKVQGRIEALDEPGRVKGKAAISLVLTQVNTEAPRAIATHPFSAEADAGTKKDALKVGGGAALGALVGAIAGGKKGAAVGAAVGGGAGTAAVLGTKGNQIKIDSETKVNFVLKNDVDVELKKSTS